MNVGCHSHFVLGAAVAAFTGLAAMAQQTPATSAACAVVVDTADAIGPNEAEVLAEEIGKMFEGEKLSAPSMK